ncbi:hypothetical protein VIGAN_02174800 [Vigna angularis var. angularis]|uniref:N-acetyltransferase domain-containing protein n=1 Tax=Vigna angularis var. angularis TaxID=157739 RepID=A0A0S3REX6_PHAAN|nr:uncharacterized protein LOC108331472 isoform X1 [Vigna angularis]BAT78975.1 hypothetical protein VIGAN_02174800 [Vigna angularis var. angularis]
MAAMGVAAQTQLQLEKRVLEGFTSRSMELKWVSRRSSKSSQLEKTKKQLRPLFPIYISTDPRHVDPLRLRDLFTDCNYSTQRFPTRPGPDPVDIHKLRIALSHSAVVVSVFCNLRHVNGVVPYQDNLSSSLMADFFTPVSPSRDQLVGFGRAVSDYGLTASIYDVVVMPSLQRMGIGRMIVKKIARVLANRDIYDIAALCSENERLFFKACGFGDDILNSTTMMYRRTVPLITQEGNKDGILLLDNGDSTQFNIEGVVRQAYRRKPQASIHQPEDHVHTNVPDYHSEPFTTTNYYNPYLGEASYHEMGEPSYHETGETSYQEVGEPSYHEATGPSYLLPRTITPPPPPPPSNVGYIPTFLPINDGLSPSYTDMSTARAVLGKRVNAGGAMGLGAGALAAGAVIFGDDFMSGFDVPSDLEMDPPF